MSSDCNHFFSWFEVVYGESEKPDRSISEIEGGSADINKGFGGDYVWLRPHTAPRPSMMVNNFWTHIGEEKDQDDLAKGAGGDYRYFQWSNDMKATHFVTDVALWRSGDKQDSAPSGWHGKTDDINKGRGGDYLYLVWRVEEYTGRK